MTLIHTGSSLLNLACSDSITGGWGTGRVINIVGDESAGKTFLALTSLAEVAGDDQFSDYLLIHDDAECGMGIDLALLGKLSERLETRNSSHTDEFMEGFFSLLENGRSFIYVLDSFDGLPHVSRVESGQKIAKGEKAKGSFGAEKAKFLSSFLEYVRKPLKELSSTLIIISQTRDNIGLGFAAKTRSGGQALYFYSWHEIWLAVKKRLVKSVHADAVEVGVLVSVKVKKNKETGKRRTVEFPIYYEYGVDDIGSLIDVLVGWGVWKATARKIQTTLDKTCSRSELISELEQNLSLLSTTKDLVQATWTEREEKLRLGRVPRFGGQK